MTPIMPLLYRVISSDEQKVVRSPIGGTTFDNVLNFSQEQDAKIKLFNPDGATNFNAGLFLSSIVQSSKCKVRMGFASNNVATRDSGKPMPAKRIAQITSANVPPSLQNAFASGQVEVAVVDAQSVLHTGMTAIPIGALQVDGLDAGASRFAASTRSDLQTIPVQQAAPAVGELDIACTPNEVAEFADGLIDDASNSRALTRNETHSALGPREGQVTVVDGEDGLVISCANMGAMDIPVRHLQEIATRISAEFAITSATLAYRNKRYTVTVEQAGGGHGHGSSQ